MRGRAGVRRRLRRGAWGVAVAALAGAGLVVSAGPAAAAPQTLFTSSTPGFAPGAATVPANVCFVTITADGGEGGAGNAGAVAAGLAALVSARMAVSPGASLDVMVGQAGGDGGPDLTPLAGAGGIGGGGGGGSDSIGEDPVGGGGGGGGASAVTEAGASLAVAGGGGGAAAGGDGTGGAGGLVGANGSGGSGPDGGGAGGTSAGGGGTGGGLIGGGGGGVGPGAAGGGNGAARGGTGAGGVGGGGGGAGFGPANPGGGGGTGTGASGAGGGLGANGGVGNDSGGNGGNGGDGGGGGGGGVGFGGGGGGGTFAGGGGGGGYGAGGGGGATSNGGGGGSSFVPVGATNVTSSADATGDGQVTITYDLDTDACAPEPVFQPDGMLGQPRLGNGIYNSTGAGQTNEQTARPTRGKTWNIYVQNDGDTTDDIVIQGTGPQAPHFNVAGYRLLVAVDGSFPWAPITTEVVAGTFTLEDVPPGGEAKIQLLVNVGKHAPVGTEKTFLVTATSGSDPTKADTVGAIMRVV